MGIYQEAAAATRQNIMDAYDVLDQIEVSLLPELSELPPLVMENNVDILPIDSFIKLYSRSSKYYMVLLGDHGDPSFAGKIKNGIKAKIMEQLGGDIKNNLEIDYTLEYMLSAMIGILTHWFLDGEKLEKEKLMKLMYALMNSDGIRRLSLLIMSRCKGNYK